MAAHEHGRGAAPRPRRRRLAAVAASALVAGSIASAACTDEGDDATAPGNEDVVVADEAEIDDAVSEVGESDAGAGAFEAQADREEAIEAAKEAGIAEILRSQEGDAFASLTDYEDSSAALDDRSGGDLDDVSPGSVTAAGDLDKNIIRRYVRRQLPRIRYCYERALLAEPGLRGTVVAEFQIGPRGAVDEVTAAGMGDDEVEACVAEAIGVIAFPAPKGGGVVNVSYPFTFEPSED